MKATTGLKEVKSWELFQTGPGDVSFNFFGRVLDDKSAKMVPKQFLIGLGVSHGVYLFLDGSRSSHIEKSRFCLAWFVQQLDKPKEDEEVENPKAKKQKVAPKK